MKLTRSGTGRDGFTLVELMIAAAITVMIMTILSICFQTSMSAMSSMRAQGDAADQLRALNTVMKRDFQANRHLPIEGAINRGCRLSDYFAGARPSSGFTLIHSPPSIKEGDDGAFDSFRGAGAWIWLTSVLPGGDESKLYTANINNVTYSSEAAEVAYFLVQSGQTASTSSLPLYNLYRRQRLVAIDSQRQALLPLDPEMVSISQGSVNTMESIAGMAQVAPTVVTPANRPPLGWTTATNYWQGDQVQHFGRRYVCVTAGVSGAGPTGVGINIPDGSARWNFFGNANSGSILTPLQATNRVGDDIILSNVISFEIKPTWHGAVGPRGYGFPTITAPGNYDIYGPTNMTSTEYPFDTLGAFQNARYEFDSLMPTSTHPQARMNAMQIRIRVYDIKVKTARQMTLIVDL